MNYDVKFIIYKAKVCTHLDTVYIVRMLGKYLNNLELDH